MRCLRLEYQSRIFWLGLRIKVYCYQKTEYIKKKKVMACKSCKENSEDTGKLSVTKIGKHNLLLRIIFFLFSLVILPFAFVIMVFYLFKVFVLTDNVKSPINDVVKLSNWWKKRKEEKLQKEMEAESGLNTYEEANVEDYELDEVQEEKVV
jgi:hypothetical protein